MSENPFLQTPALKPPVETPCRNPLSVMTFPFFPAA